MNDVFKGIDYAIENDTDIILAKKQLKEAASEDEDFSLNDSVYPRYATMAKILQILRMPNGKMKVLFEATDRIKLESVNFNKDELVLQVGLDSGTIVFYKTSVESKFLAFDEIVNYKAHSDRVMGNCEVELRLIDAGIVISYLVDSTTYETSVVLSSSPYTTKAKININIVTSAIATALFITTSPFNLYFNLYTFSYYSA